MNKSLNLALGALTAVLMVAAIYMVFVYVPTEADQGIVQRIFYFHVPCAWVAFGACGLVAICGIFWGAGAFCECRLTRGQDAIGERGNRACGGGYVFNRCDFRGMVKRGQRNYLRKVTAHRGSWH